MSIMTRREIISYLVIMSEAEQQEMLRHAQQIIGRRDVRDKLMSDDVY